MGETEKKGTGTNMWSEHRALKYIDSGGSENDWGGMICAYDTAEGWKWTPVTGSNNDYDVINVAGSC
jgi:hypothetical protein